MDGWIENYIKKIFLLCENHHVNKKCITASLFVFCVTCNGINSANLYGLEPQRIHCNRKPVMKYMKSVHFIIRVFHSLFWVVKWPLGPYLMPLITRSITSGCLHIGKC